MQRSTHDDFLTEAHDLTVMFGNKPEDETVIPLDEYNAVLENYFLRMTKFKSMMTRYKDQLSKVKDDLEDLKAKNKKLKRRLKNSEEIFGHLKQDSFKFLRNIEKDTTNLLECIKDLDMNEENRSLYEITYCDICMTTSYKHNLYHTTCCQNANVCSQCIENLNEQQMDFQTQSDGVTIREEILLEAKCPYCREPYKTTPWSYFCK